MWVRFAVSLGVGVAVLVGLILWVSHHNGNGLATESPKAAARADREAAIVVAQDQAPRVVAVASGGSRAAVVHAIRRDMLTRISKDDAGAPLQRVSCTHAGTQGSRHGYHCVAVAASVNYPYQAVLNSAAHTLTFCKHDAPPVPSQNVPVSPRCRL